MQTTEMYCAIYKAKYVRRIGVEMENKIKNV